jgi:hypothetical protein
LYRKQREEGMWVPLVFALCPGFVKFITKPGKEIRACMFFKNQKKKNQKKLIKFN